MTYQPKYLSHHIDYISGNLQKGIVQCGFWCCKNANLQHSSQDKSWKIFFYCSVVQKNGKWVMMRKWKSAFRNCICIEFIHLLWPIYGFSGLVSILKVVSNFFSSLAVFGFSATFSFSAIFSFSVIFSSSADFSFSAVFGFSAVFSCFEIAFHLF